MSRSSNRRKKQLFPFGYLMIPLIGIIGVGLLFWGGKLFFMPKPESPSLDYVEQNASPVLGKVTNVEVIEEDVPEEGVVAVPIVVDPKRPHVSQPEMVQPSSQKPQKNPSQATRPPTAKTPSTAPNPTGTSWLVQIGSFKQKSMADSLASEVRSKGFKVTVGRGNVDGVVYYRVLIPGGNNRPEAQSLGEKLSSMGYPYFIFPRK
ncbi:Sporulation related domain-containing protein [Dethiosulfovibrio salsuginis]|uniref:Sporulation related domain-containing protein n=2 Tax=Dethiosulfovibrio salsuginis TaxID=561720 RepID=A0A1X7I7R2_9BACT|nr:Sporulation related domain-containing protein [Dethiosulfovibrio salsuginis]